MTILKTYRSLYNEYLNHTANEYSESNHTMYETLSAMQLQIKMEREKFEQMIANYWNNDAYDNGIFITSAEAIYTDTEYVVLSYPRKKYTVQQLIQYLERVRFRERIDASLKGVKVWLKPISHHENFGVDSTFLKENLHIIIGNAKAVITISEDLRLEQSWYSCVGSFIEQLYAKRVWFINDINITDYTEYTKTYIKEEIKEVFVEKLTEKQIDRVYENLKDYGAEEQFIVSILANRYDDDSCTSFESVETLMNNSQKIKNTFYEDCNEKFSYQLNIKALIDGLYEPQATHCYMPQSMRHTIRCYKYTTNLVVHELDGVSIQIKICREKSKNWEILVAIDETNNVWVMEISKHEHQSKIGCANAHIEKLKQLSGHDADEWVMSYNDFGSDYDLLKSNGQVVYVGADEYETMQLEQC